MNAFETVQCCRRIKAKQRKLEMALQDLVDSVRRDVKKGRLSVKEMAEVDRIHTIWLIKEAGLVPDLKEAHRLVTKLVGKAKPGELEKQRDAPL